MSSLLYFPRREKKVHVQHKDEEKEEIRGIWAIAQQVKFYKLENLILHIMSFIRFRGFKIRYMALYTTFCWIMFSGNSLQNKLKHINFVLVKSCLAMLFGIILYSLCELLYAPLYLIIDG